MPKYNDFSLGLNNANPVDQIDDRELSVANNVEYNHSTNPEKREAIKTSELNAALAQLENIGGSVKKFIAWSPKVMPNVSSAENDDDENRVSFYYTDSADNQDEYARITMVSEDVTTTEEDGEIKFSVIEAGTMDDVVTIGGEDVLIEGVLTVDAINGVTTAEAINDKYTGDLSPAIDSYTKFLSVYITVPGVNAGACSLQLNSLAEVNILNVDGAAPAANDLNTTGVFHLVYNGTNFILLNPATAN